MRVEHEQVQALVVSLVMHGGDEHAAGVDTHHRARREIDYCNVGLADKLFGLVVCVNSRKNGESVPVPSSSVNLSSFFDLGTASHARTFTARKSDFEKVSKST